MIIRPRRSSSAFSDDVEAMWLVSQLVIPRLKTCAKPENWTRMDMLEHPDLQSLAFEAGYTE
jgi:hypothetical protein